MPQMNKGGKFIFGISVIKEDLSVQFPTQAVKEYDISSQKKVILFTGSKSTGGFCVTTYPLLASSKLKHILDECEGLNNCSIPTGTFVPYKGRAYTWIPINSNGRIQLNPEVMNFLKLSKGSELLSIRSSDIAFTMGAKGPLLDKAQHYTGYIEKY